MPLIGDIVYVFNVPGHSNTTAAVTSGRAAGIITSVEADGQSCGIFVFIGSSPAVGQHYAWVPPTTAIINPNGIYYQLTRTS